MIMKTRVQFYLNVVLHTETKTLKHQRQNPDDQTSLVNRSRPPIEPSSGRRGLPLRPLWQVRGEEEELIIVDRYHRYRSWSCGSNSTKSGNRKRKHTKVQPCTPLGTKLSSLVVKGAGVSGPDYTGTLTSVSDNGKHFHVLRKYIKYISVTHSLSGFAVLAEDTVIWSSNRSNHQPPRERWDWRR